MAISNKAQYLLLAPYSGNFPAIRQLIIEALQEDGLVPILAEEVSTLSTSTVEGIMRAIKQADFVIADVTGQNPNVMFELGLAVASKKLALLVSQDSKDVPFDMRHQHVFVYDPAKPEILRDGIRRWVWLFQAAA
jgi:nucleoside 2-deoxyribosyltransferase